jgi:hypothetical protein
MNKELKQVLIAALNGVAASANFSAEETDKAAINALLKEIGIDENSTGREIRAKEDLAFALIEEAVDEILPKKLEGVLQEFAEVRSFARDAEVLFNIEKIGKNRAKLTISKGARGGIYRAAKLDRKYFSVDTTIQTVAVSVTLEEIILGTLSLAELYSNILEGFQEIVYKEVFNALASGRAVAGYDRIEKDGSAKTVKADLGKAIDKVMPYVKQYGIPTIFGSYQALAELANPASEFHPEMMDSAERRQYGFVQLYKGSKVVELPNYLVDNKNDTWFYDPKYVFVLPSGIKPVKVALKGDLTLIRNTSAVGSEKWEAHKLIGVGVAMANNFAVIEVSDLN